MKKVIQTVGLVLLFLVIAVFLFLKYLGSRPVISNSYQQSLTTNSAVEAKYMANGEFDVSLYEEPVLQVFKKYIIYYPADLETSDRAYPVIVFCNGSGTPLSKYPALPKHYASWGFIVIGTEEENAWNGFGAEMCVRHLQRLNDSEQIQDGEANIFYQKVDLDHLGITGHSQGGVGVLNAITEQKNSGIYKAAVSLSPTNKELAHALEWDYDASLVSVPVLFISGAGGGDDWVVTGEQLADIYRDVPGGKVMAGRKDTPHGQTLYAADGYVTAWFLWQLQGDQEAGRAFTGQSPELLENPLYQNVALDLAPP